MNQEKNAVASFDLRSRITIRYSKPEQFQSNAEMDDSNRPSKNCCAILLVLVVLANHSERKKLFFLLLLHLLHEPCLDAKVLGDADGMALVDGSAVKGDKIA